MGCSGCARRCRRIFRGDCFRSGGFGRRRLGSATADGQKRQRDAQAQKYGFHGHCVIPLKLELSLLLRRLRRIGRLLLLLLLLLLFANLLPARIDALLQIRCRGRRFRRKRQARFAA